MVIFVRCIVGLLAATLNYRRNLSLDRRTAENVKGKRSQVHFCCPVLVRTCREDVGHVLGCARGPESAG